MKTLVVMAEEKKKVKGISALVENSNCSTLVKSSLPVRRTFSFFFLWLPPTASRCLKATGGHLKKKMTPDQLRPWSS